MLNIPNTEKQASKRVQRFLLHTSTEENIEPAHSQLVINTITGSLAVHLYNEQRFVKTLPIRSIVEFFGKEYNETNASSISEHLKKMAEENNIPYSKANVVICQNKGELKAHLYNENKYVKRLSTIELLRTVY